MSFSFLIADSRLFLTAAGTALPVARPIDAANDRRIKLYRLPDRMSEGEWAMDRQIMVHTDRDTRLFVVELDLPVPPLVQPRAPATML
jgi:hypothetical protein